MYLPPTWSGGEPSAQIWVDFPFFSCARVYSFSKHYIVLLLYSRSVSGCFSLVDVTPCLLMCRCPIFVFLDFSRCLLISFLVRPGHVFRNPCLVVLMRLVVVGMNSAACKYCASYDFDVCAIMLFITAAGCWVFRGTSHIPVSLFLVPSILILLDRPLCPHSMLIIGWQCSIPEQLLQGH